MGLGKLGGNDVIHKRKFRWTFAVKRENGNNVPASFVKMAARPNISFEETEINFLNGKTFLPGKGTWETITITYYDVSIIAGNGAGGGNQALWSWLASVYDFTDHTGLKQSSARGCYGGEGICKLYDGCGDELERWVLFDCWPQAVNFGELDYSSSEEVTIEVTLRYSGVEYSTQGQCKMEIKPECCGCNTGFGGGTDVDQSAVN